MLKVLKINKGKWLFVAQFRNPWGNFLLIYQMQAPRDWQMNTNTPHKSVSDNLPRKIYSLLNKIIVKCVLWAIVGYRPTSTSWTSRWDTSWDPRLVPLSRQSLRNWWLRLPCRYRNHTWRLSSPTGKKHRDDKCIISKKQRIFLRSQTNGFTPFSMLRFFSRYSPVSGPKKIFNPFYFTFY